MKNQILSIPLLKEQDVQSSIKQQDNSSQHDQGHQRKDNLFFICIQKTIFIELRQRKLEFIQKILSQLQMNQSGSRAKYQKEHLIDYLKKIKDLKFGLQTKYFNKALIYFKKMFFRKIAMIWQNLSEQRKIEYEQIGIQNHKKVEESQKKQVNINKFTGLQMLKIDVLCVCFLFNKHYVTAFKDIRRKLLPYDLLQKIFALNKSDIQIMDRNFKQLQRNICIDYRQELRHHIQLLYLMRVGCKICNYASYTRVSIQSIPFVETSLDVDITDQVYSSKNPKIRFCQIAFQPIVNILKKKTQFQAGDLKMQQQLLQIAKQYCVSYEFLLRIGIQFGDSWSSHKEELISRLQSSLYKCQWIFLKGKYSLGDGINSAFGGIFPSKPLFWSKRLGLVSAITKIAMQRFRLLPTIFNMQIQLQSKLSIYVYKFQYSLRDYIGKQNEEQAQDLKCTVVILVANQRILAYSVSRNPLTYDLYINMIKLCIRNSVASQIKQFNLVAYDFDYEQSVICDLFVQFQIYMNKTYDARIYVVNDPSLFQPHFLIHAFIKCFLLELSINSSNFHQYTQVCINHLLKGIEFFDKNTYEEYFTYFTKIMGLELGIKDVWKCFKEDRGNRYNAVIFSGQGNEEEVPTNIQQIIKVKIPQLEWFQSIQYCSPSFDNFVKFQEQQKWRALESFEESRSPNDFEVFLQRKHMKVKDIKRILRDVTRFLIDYQLAFQQLTKKYQAAEKSAQFIKIWNSLSNCYEQQNAFIDQVYSRSERQAIIKQFSKKFDKATKVSDFCKINKFKSMKIKSQQQQ